MINNCTSLAFKFEGAIDPSHKLALTYGITYAIAEMAKEHQREIREIEDENSPLESGEWMILFFGFWTYRKKFMDFYYTDYDYHFCLRKDDGFWVQRDLGEPIKNANIDLLIKDAKKEGVPYKFYAVKKVSD